MPGYRKRTKSKAAVEVKRERQDIGSRQTMRAGSFDSQTGSPGYRSKTNCEARQLWKSNRKPGYRQKKNKRRDLAGKPKRLDTEINQTEKPCSCGSQT
ncbi:hypothetical protein PoB_002595900 [Plakobranchus ocellatus]|uniref:Uncharacterized protein n=1 Tax=Plakobranchus ocellatus TaxID=259542 RepID=A0AAV3ZYJ3_9GAST|nr:hypothetical protein PoB_002595900 [Plakobranchus ocellatus]